MSARFSSDSPQYCALIHETKELPADRNVSVMPVDRAGSEKKETERERGAKNN